MKKDSNYNRFLLLWSGEIISAIGGGLTSFGLSVYVFQETGSAGSMALVALLAFLPTLLLSAPAGVLADRYDRRLLMMAGDGLSAVGLVFILVCMLMGRATLFVICVGVFISAVFSSLLEPAYRATVTDLLTKEEYSKASGMMSIAGSARYLISPLIAGLLLTVSDVKLLLLIDTATFFLTVVCTAIVRKGITARQTEKTGTFRESFREGWQAVTEKRGILILIIVSSVMTCFMGAMQILAEPMILDFESSRVLGIAETVCASGMLVSSVIIGIRGLKRDFTKILSISLALAGLSMTGFGLKENIVLICFFGFLFFFMLPFANNCLDYLTRTNIAAEKQGRAWGLISFLSQIGYVVAYGGAGFLADKVAAIRHTGVGRGAAAVIMVSGALLAAVSIALYQFKDVKELEGDNNEQTADH
ncbi:MAG: MFS transporter [Lachnospiraceae bacterium]|nr:MFS transporter [Lachnospiraceae bacterium]